MNHATMYKEDDQVAKWVGIIVLILFMISQIIQK